MRIKTLLITAIASILLATAPAKASLIQSFTCSADPNFSCSGDVVFDGVGGISDLDISGDAWGEAYSITNITGGAVLDVDWVVLEWDWGHLEFVGNIILFLRGTDLKLTADCTAFVGPMPDECAGMEEDTAEVDVSFTHVSEPGSFGLLTVGWQDCSSSGAAALPRALPKAPWAAGTSIREVGARTPPIAQPVQRLTYIPSAEEPSRPSRSCS